MQFLRESSRHVSDLGASLLRRLRGAGAPGLQDAILGHELRNPLNGVLGMAQLLQGTALSREQRQWLRAIHESGMQMEHLLKDADATARGKKHDRPPHGTVDGVKLLEQVILSHTPEAVRKGIDLLLTVYREVPRQWRVDACRLRQLVDNLLGNALRYTDRGHVLLEARTTGAATELAAGLELLVRDTGTGIPPAASKKIFRAYGKAGGPRDGSGLGLHVCRRIVDAMSGEICFESRPGAGTCFRVRLPAVLTRRGRSAFPSRLLTANPVGVCLDEPLTKAVCSILSRLGVSFGRCSPDRNTMQSKAPSILLIDAQSLSRHADPAFDGADDVLFLANASAGTVLPEMPRWTVLHPPFLECTIAPALMEISLSRGGCERRG